MAVAEGSLAVEDGTGGKGGAAAEYTRDGSVDLRGNPVLRSKRGGWTACSFIVVYELFERMAYYGIASNLVIYLTEKLHQGTVEASNNVTNWSGTVFLTPLLGAYVADAYLGRYWTFVVGSVIYFMMGKSMDKRKRLIRGAAVFVVWAAIVVAVRVLKRKRRPRISYGPMHERDRMRIDYLTSKIWHSDVTCINMLRFNRASFFRLCEIMRERQLLENSVHLCVEQQVAMFLHTIGHNVRNRVVSTNFGRSFSTTSIYFRQVLHAIGELRNEYIRPPSSETPEKIAGNPRFDPYFKDCIGAIDGTHVRASVVKDVEDSFRGRKPFPTQNVMAAVDFDLRFTYVLAGWEGTAHDANVLADALGRERGLQVPEGKYYLVDAGYGAKPGFIPPFRNVRYHLNEWGNNPVQNAEELFNLRHSSLRIAVERAFGSLKRRFKILDDAKPFFPFPVQVDIVVACCVLHNYALSQGIDEFILPEVTWTAQPIRSQTQQARDHRATVDRRQQIATQMWADRQIMYGH